LNITELAPFAKIACPQCGAAMRVKCEFGPYTLVRRHAAGGMSMVFAAQDQTLGREVALKILSEEFSANGMRIAAFEEEARITASISHPNVVKVFTTGRAFGRFYIAMEMVPGGHFEQRIREAGKIPEAEVLPLAIEVAQGLKAAHAAGLIHRDVKPGNILLDAEGHAKLVDFGLALVTHDGKAKAAELWATPYYVPPETVEGHAEDFRSDIYAFGATLYHALSGQPSCGEQTMATDVLREAKKKVRPLETVDSSISTETCRIVGRAMAYAPEARYGSYDEMIADLTAALGHLAAGRAESAGSARQRRGRRRLLACAVACVALLAAGALYLWQTKRREKQTLSAIAPPVVAAQPAAGMVDHSAEIARRFRTAREAVDARNFELAGQEFAALRQNPAVQEPTRSWAAVEAVLAAYLDGRPQDARRQADAAMKHLQSLPARHLLGGKEWRGLLAGLDSLEPLACPKPDSNASRVIAGMLAGLKNWEQGLLDPAAACFESVVSAKLTSQEQWAGVYQKLAADYLVDHQLLAGPLFAEEPADKAGCEALIARLDEALATLKTGGRARFNTLAWRADLMRRAKLLESAPAAKPAPPEVPAPQEPATPSAPAREEALARLAEFSREWRFQEAAAYLKQLPADPPGVSRSALLAIAESAEAFLSATGRDLAKEPFTGELPLANGETVARVAIGASGDIVATSANGDPRPCSWSDFAPDSLIAIHRVLVKDLTSETERLRRHEWAIAFDWLVGNRERALSAAARLSQSSPAFKERWEFIAAGLPH
jgi:tRNA A-37 threonylcarbamoyl transferase component Bud32